MPFVLGSSKTVDSKRAAFEAARATTRGVNAGDAAIIQYTPPDKCPDRNRIVFDDSDSMYGQIENAKKGVVEYLRNCILNQTAVALHFMNTTTWSTALRSNLIELGQDIEEVHLASGGTPLFETLRDALLAEPTLTRLIAFTDGAPGDSLQAIYSEEIQTTRNDVPYQESADVIIRIAHEVGKDCIPIDTVYFGYENSSAMSLLRYISDQTGGFFLHFDPAKVNFKTAFKYLAPVNRLQLMSGSFRASLERGEQK
jgi:hypothetical protein